MHVIREGLKLRKECPELFHRPVYTPLYTAGGNEENVCAFSLSLGSQRIIAVAPRFFASMVPDVTSTPMGDVWGEARLPVAPGAYVDVLTGERHAVVDGHLRMSTLLRRFPVALLRSP
jgi:maltooligosyltrehalose synthase